MPRVVIIEDNPQSARLAEKLLKRASYEVFLAEDGESGYGMVLSHAPDIVLVDLGLPDFDGQTIIAMLRQHASLQKTPIIAFTAWPEDTAHDMALAYGCDGVITKPIDTRLFVEQVQTFLDASLKK
ncbi:MAG: response regulator [Phototrophicaceae bacterium]